MCLLTSQGGNSLLTEDQDADAFVRIFLFSSADIEKHFIGRMIMMPIQILKRYITIRYPML